MDTDLEHNEVTTTSINLEYGDIIQLIAPANKDIHEVSGLITYVDNTKIKLINISSGEPLQLNINDFGSFTDESIQNLFLINRSEEKGYARQHGLLTGKWINIHFGGDIPAIITGEITNLEEDRIEVTTYPEIHTIYFDFGYQGIPENLPIDKIVIRTKPDTLISAPSLIDMKEKLEEDPSLELKDLTEEELAEMEYTEEGEAIMNIPSNVISDELFKENLKDLYVDANEIVFGEKLEPVKQLIEVPESERRYGIEAQVNDMMDELLSTIPNYKRTGDVMDNIHLIIERFKDLRERYSLMDENYNVIDKKTNGPNHKPLVERLKQIDTNLKWLIPVVSTRRYIYNKEGEGLTQQKDVVETNENINDTIYKLANDVETFKKSKNSSEVNNYTQHYKDVSEYLKAKELPLDHAECITTKSVLTDLDTVIDNLGEFKSSVYNSKNNDPKHVKYVIQRYNLGLSKINKTLTQSGKAIYLRENMTDNDNLCLKSLLMMPSEVVQFSKVDLPGTNILERSQLHTNYVLLYKLLKSNKGILPNIISDLSKEHDYEGNDKESKIDFLSTINEFLLDSESTDVDIDNNDKYARFLEAIVPKTRYLIRLMKKYIRNKTSFVGVVEQLEPFMIYPSDISYKQFMEIRYFIKEQISELKKKIASDSKSFYTLKNKKYNVNSKPNSLISLLTGDNEANELFVDNYKFMNKDGKMKEMTVSEMLKYTVSKDNNELFSTIITSMLTSLITPSNLMEALALPLLDDVDKLDKIKPSDCSKRYLSKKYTSIGSLQEDNNVDELYYDADLDDTPYSILDKYKEKQKELSPELFKKFLIESLIHKHDVEEGQAEEVSKILISRKKPVREGDHAIVEVKPTLNDEALLEQLTEEEKEDIADEQDVRKKTMYYIRKKGTWVRDNEINDEAFIDTNTLFCNISEECVKNNDNKQCESEDFTKKRIQESHRKNMINEFENRFAISSEELIKKIEKKLVYLLKYNKKLVALNEIQQYKANNLAYALGNYSQKDEILQSPHLELLNMINAQDDFAKKQTDIVNFEEKFCRNPLSEQLDESPYWLYCKETNTKLLPMSLFELAKTFVTGGDYNNQLEKLCHSHGILSDDGDSIVDKYSGQVLRKLDYINEDTYDESGFRMVTHSVMEKDIGDVMVNITKKKETTENNFVFDNAVSETIYNVFSTICDRIDIDKHNNWDMVHRTTTAMYEPPFLMSEKKYNKRIEAAKKDNKKIQSYQDYSNETLIMIVASAIFVSVQTAIPGFTTNKTFPGCVRSFTGYPMDGREDLTGLKYMACIMFKTKSSIQPWDSLKKYNTDRLATRLEKTMEKMIERPDMEELYTLKREYMILHPTTSSPEVHAIQKWRTFMPPVVKFKLDKQVQNVSNDFRSEIAALMKRGHKDQFKGINVVKGKNIMYGFSIIETINRIVKDQDALLTTSANLPFLENACCNDKEVNPLLYFMNKDESMKHILHAVNKNQDWLQNIKEWNSAPLLYHKEPTGIVYPQVKTGNLEENIYSAIITHCGYDRDLPLPEKFKGICSEKPEEYRKQWNIQEKIAYIKKNGNKYNESHLTHVMDAIYKDNIVDIDNSEIFDQVENFKSIINHLEDNESLAFPTAFLTLLKKTLETYEPKKMTVEMSDELKQLEKYLYTSNKTMYNDIEKHLSLKRDISNTHRLGESNIKYIGSFLSEIEYWSIGKEDELKTICQFIRNAIYNMTKTFPNSFVNSDGFHSGFNSARNIWKLSTQHVGDLDEIVAGYYEDIRSYFNDPILKELMVEFEPTLREVSNFVDNIPIQSEIIKLCENNKPVHYHSALNKDVIIALHKYCLLSCITNYIDITNNSEMIHTDIEKNKSIRKKENETNANPSNNLVSLANQIDENNIESNNELVELNITIGDRTLLSDKIKKILLTLLTIETKNKKLMNVSYDDIIKGANRVREKEKRGMIDYLGKMTIEERKIEDSFKRYKLGDWNVGQQKSVFVYDRNVYDKEREKRGFFIDEPVTEQVTNDSETIEVNDFEQLDQILDAGFDRNQSDISHLPSNYDDGDAYPEERDEDDFPED
jgi:AraC-like DNA-binding protein